MKCNQRVLLCCVIAWFCCSFSECHENLLDADGKALKERRSTDEVSDEVCKSDFPGCMDAGGKCYVDAGNEKEQSKVHCECPEMKSYKKWIGCEDCYCGKNSTGCKFDRLGKKICECNPEFSQKGETCAECDCGENSIGCSFKEDMFWRPVLTCTCHFGFKQKGDKCEECYCGEKSFDCEFEKGEKKCECFSGYGPKDGVCTKCHCGEKSYGCVFENDEKKCDCYRGYAQKFGVCTECACGAKSWGCTFEEGVKKCDCFQQHGDMDGICTKCYCGEKSWRCTFKKRVKETCDCFSHYAHKDGVCTECYCGTQKGTASCHFDNGEKKCECEVEYTYVNGECRDLPLECALICGQHNDVTCDQKGNQTLCLCGEGKIFDYKMKKCRIDYCYEDCGVIPGELPYEVECEGDPFKPVNCICVEYHKKFDPVKKKCIDFECEEICGGTVNEEMVCDHRGNHTLCLCGHGKKFDFQMKKCREEQHGTNSGLSASAIDAIVVGVLVSIALLV